MDNFDEKRCVVNAEDLTDGTDFIGEFSDELNKYQGRIAGSEQETACARAIRNRLHDETDAKTRLEAFRAYPLAGRGSFLCLGIWFALCYVVYFISFAGNRLAGALVTALALAMFVAGATVLMLIYLGDLRLAKILPRKVSYNVVSEFSKSEEVEHIYVVADNHDAKLGSLIKDFNVMRKVAVIVPPISAFVFVLFCILKMALGTSTGNVAAKISVLTIFPVVTGIFGIVAFVLHYSPRAKDARQTSGTATCIAMATYAYFVEKPELLPDKAKVVYVSLGAENCAHCGSEAFVKAHPEYAGAKVLCIDDVYSGEIKIVDTDVVRKLQYSPEVASALQASAAEQGIDVSVLLHDTLKHKFNSLHGFASNAFAKNGSATATLTSRDYSTKEKPLTKEQTEQLFSLCVGAFEKLMQRDEQSQPKPDTPEEVVDKVAPSAEMEIVDVESK